LFADIIIDIVHEAVDRIFEYKIPAHLESRAALGKTVQIPFGAGNRTRTGYIVGIKEIPEYDPALIKEIIDIRDNEIESQRRLIKLAVFMKQEYGCTMIQALKTVLPVQEKMNREESKSVILTVGRQEGEDFLIRYETRHQVAKARVLKRLLCEADDQEQGKVCDCRNESKSMFREMEVKEISLSYTTLIKEEKVSLSTLKSMEKDGVISICSDCHFRNPIKSPVATHEIHPLNSAQQLIYEEFVRDYDDGIRRTYLLHGVTGSGKTEVYMSLIRKVIEEGKQVIVLIPEISLTFQTVNRFYTYFGDRVSFVNSRLSKGEKYDQFVRAQNGDIDIMIGPRSALFTPFQNLGLIIIDEEHEGAYKSEITPKYHAREVAEHLAKTSNASLVLGSATPSLEAYTKALKGEYRLWILKERANKMELPKISVVDLRQELKEGNRSMFSRELRYEMEQRLRRKEQVMLFLNRRGYAGFISCRVCGKVMKCPHCDISLTFHRAGQMSCHYCGYERPAPMTCPAWGSKHITAFGTGTQKVEAALYKEFPEARIMRMDFDTTRKKESYNQMLEAFSKGEADILVGTQMIVKGHDFSKVTLMGILAADLSLHSGDYRAAEKTFQLVTQASGRAGRGKLPGQVIIQTYQPDHYAILASKRQNYEEFYAQEMTYRRILKYPPCCEMLVIFATSDKEEICKTALDELAAYLKRAFPDIHMIGPSEGAFKKINDIYRRVIYIKETDIDRMKQIRSCAEDYSRTKEIFKQVHLYYDKNPMGIY